MSNKKNKQSNPYFENIDNLIDNTFARLKDMVDANTIIGNTIQLSDKMFIIPISKVSVGLISGGGEMTGKKKNNMSINAGSTTGFTLTPMGFITINEGAIDFLGSQTVENNSIKILDSFVDICQKVIEKKVGENEKE